MVFLISLLAGVLVLYVVILVFAAWVSVHPPRIPLFLSPGSCGLPQENVEFIGREGLPLAGWWVEHPESRGVVILSHGYCMNRSEPASAVFPLYQQGFSCLLYDFPAFGTSPGRTSGLGWLERADVRAAMEFVREKKPEERVILWGSSMGAAASAFASAESAPDGLILDSAYSRLVDAIGGWWNFVGGRGLEIVLAPLPMISGFFVPFRLRDVDVSRALAQLDGVPVLLLHGDGDTLADPSHAERNLAALGGAGRLVWLHGCGHSEGRWIQPEAYAAALTEYLDHNFPRK